MKILYIVVIAFIFTLFAGFLCEEYYISKSQINITTTLKNEIQTLINAKKISTLKLADYIAQDKNLIRYLKTKNSNKIIKNTLKEYEKYSHVNIGIVDKYGINRYLSWTDKGVGVNILKSRTDLRQFFKSPHPMGSISVGKFDITFKGIIPIYNKKHQFLGAVEVITHFNSIIKNLKKDDISTLLVVHKRFNKQLTFASSKTFIDGYYISNTHLSPLVTKLLKKYAISRLISIKDFIAINFNNNDFVLFQIPIYSNEHQKIANFIVFTKDKYYLSSIAHTINLIIFIVALLFFILVYLVYKNIQKNSILIKTLAIRVEEKTQQNLELIYKDSLTGSYKKSKFEFDRVNEIDKFVIMFNIRNFSKINEEYGFKNGDEILRIIAQRVMRITKHKLYRINADEFVFMAKNIKYYVTAIKQSFIEEPIELNAQNIKLRISFSFSAIKNDKKDILRRLAIALKSAKKQPSKKFVYYTPKPTKQDFIKFNSLLYDALFIHKVSSIIPYFQGIRDNKTGKMYKYEALARLNHMGKIYSPYFFIEIAKNSGFIFEITKIMIDKSFKLISKTDHKISINITEDDLLSRHLKNYLLDMLNKYNIEAPRVTLEILEGITSTGAKNNIAQLKELKKLGFKLAIDDFGVEYSNFERISELDVDFIKIDGKYIKNIDSEEKSYKIAKAITGFAHSLNIKVIAEFVENTNIQKIVEEIGIDYSQGYHFSKPHENI